MGDRTGNQPLSIARAASIIPRVYLFYFLFLISFFIIIFLEMHCTTLNLIVPAQLLVNDLGCSGVGKTKVMDRIYADVVSQLPLVFKCREDRRDSMEQIRKGLVSNVSLLLSLGKGSGAVPWMHA